MKKTISKFLSAAVIVAATLTITSCIGKKFHVNGTVSDAKDSVLYFENVGLNGPEVVDSVKLDEKGNFAFDVDATDAPEFYRLRIAGQAINVSIDSTETVSVKASYPTMAYKYEVSGSENCSKIKELALMQMNLQGQVNAIEKNPNIGVDAADAAVVSVLESYKKTVKLNYIFKEPMKAYSYYALFQTINIDGGNVLIFNPRSSEEDVKVFAAVATSWDTYYPKAERGLNLHNIAIEGMKNIRAMKKQNNQTIDASKINMSGVIEIALTDNNGHVRRLTELAGHVVLLDFHLFASDVSTKRIMMLRELYNKYHAKGLEIYQVSVDENEHFWKTQTAALPWISVRADENSSVLSEYNVQNIPMFYLIGKDGVVYKRDVQIKNLDAEISALL